MKNEIFFVCSNPKDLYVALHTAIQNQAIRTWDIDSDGDFVHLANQWHKQGWLRPYINHNGLGFWYISRKNSTMNDDTRAALIGFMLGTMIRHFEDAFDKGIS